jgi:hypothetical protein
MASAYQCIGVKIGGMLKRLSGCSPYAISVATGHGIWRGSEGVAAAGMTLANAKKPSVDSVMALSAWRSENIQWRSNKANVVINERK